MTGAAIVASSLVLAGVVGFAAHRASICTVKAVEEIFATRRALMFASFAKTVLWIIAAALVMQILVPESRIETIGWAISLPAILGGLIFGIGADVNGGCAFSTLTRLGAGQVGMVVTMIGFALGVATHAQVPGWTSDLAPGTPFLLRDGGWSIAITAAVGLWAVWEAARIWRGRAAGSTWRQRVAADRYRLSTAAALMGIANAILYARHGTWPYTKVLGYSVRQLAGVEISTDPTLWMLFGALVVGVIVSARLAKSFELEWRPRAAWLGNLAGGRSDGRRRRYDPRG